MLRVLLFPLLIAAAVLAACNPYSSNTDTGAPVPTAIPVVNPARQGPCNSRLGGKITNVGTDQPTANVAVEVKAGGKAIKTVTDNNGLYGFAGLCAGEYVMTITPPGGSTISNPNTVTLNGSDPVKVNLPYR